MLTADVLARLIKAKRSGNGQGYMGHCPAHDDSTASLSFMDRIDGKGLLFNCFAGCSYPRIVEEFRKLGIEIHEHANGHDHTPTFEAVYNYIDENGKLLFQVVRKKGKQFSQRQPNGNSGWTWNLNGVRRVLYRLPEVVEAVASSQPIFIVEGEKDVDSLRKLNIVATTNPSGAGKWRPEYNESLRDADVVIIPDNDEAGRKHADQVAAMLQRIAKRVRVLKLPNLSPKGDASDWITAGGVAKQMWELIENVPDWEPARQAACQVTLRQTWQQRTFTADALQTMTFPPLRFILPGLVPEGATLLVSRPKLGKSWLVLDLALAVAAGRFTLGELKPSPGAVLYLALEDGPRRLQRRMTKLLPTFSGVWPPGLRIATEWPRADQGGLADIEGWLQTTLDARCIVVDTLAQFRKVSNGKQQVYADDYAAISDLQRLASKYNVAVIIVHHDRKGEADDVFDTVSGSLGLTGAADTILILKRHANAVTLHVRGRDIEEAEKALQFDKRTCRWMILGEAADVNRSAERSRVLAVLRDAGQPMAAKDIWLAAELRNRNATDLLLGKMAKDGVIVRADRGRYTLSETDPGQIEQKERLEGQAADLKEETGNLSNLSKGECVQ